MSFSFRLISANPKPNVVVHPVCGHESVEKGSVVLLVLFEFRDDHHLVVVVLFVHRTVNVIDQEFVCGMNTGYQIIRINVHHADEINQVSVMVNIDQRKTENEQRILLVSSQEQRMQCLCPYSSHDTSSPPLPATAPRCTHGRSTPSPCKTAQLVLAQRVELGKGFRMAHKAGIESKHQIRRAVLVVFRTCQL